MIVDVLIAPIQQGYIAGTTDGIVTVGGRPAVKDIIVLDADTLIVMQRTGSLPNGHYLIAGLNPNQRYLVMCRDHEHQYEPFCWDYVRPATDLTFAEQLALWQSWQS